MRIIVTTLLLFVVGFFAGGLVAQTLAVQTGADQEFILVFFAVAAVLFVSTLVFFIVQFFENTRRAARIAAIILLALLAIAAVALIVWDQLEAREGTTVSNSWPIIAGLMLPNMVTIIVQWLIVRWRSRPDMAHPLFGRGPGPD